AGRGSDGPVPLLRGDRLRSHKRRLREPFERHQIGAPRKEGASRGAAAARRQGQGHWRHASRAEGGAA
ncbi:unnamed protein product, partial [Closterium sp. NIES-54]